MPTVGLNESASQISQASPAPASPLYPFLHRHVKEPGVLRHSVWAKGEHVPVTTAHSSTSAHKEPDVFLR